MNQEVTKFDYFGQGVRIFEEDGKALFVAADVARVLGHRDAANMLRALKTKDKGTRLMSTPGGEQELTVITEPGFYRAVLIRETGRMTDQGTRDAVDAFQEWVTHEVLPQIRKTGAYGLDPRSLDRRDILRMALEAEEQRLAAERQLEAARPATEYFNRFVADADVCTVKDWGAAFGLTGPQAYQLLLDRGVVYRKQLGTRWSNRQHKLIEENEYRPYAGKPAYAWFDLRPQHNAPRLHNGQVRQTLYVRRQFLIDLGRLVGLTPAATQGELVSVENSAGQEADR